MAKKRRTGVKSQAIREHLAQQPEATPKEIKEALSQRGITVTDGLISNIKYAAKKQGKKPGRPRKAAGQASAMAGSNSGGSMTADQLIETKRLVDQLGGIEQAERALDVLKQLS